MNYRYYRCDVFTDTRFGGNPLAVLPEADGLSDRQMQQIAREFNISETSFVFPTVEGHTRRVQIFTPAREVPFAGHPNVGTAFILATTGALGDIRSSQTVTFEEKAGIVAVDIHARDGRITSCNLTAPQPLSLGPCIAARQVAAVVSLAESDVVVDTHDPQEVSVGLPFLMAELRDPSALERAQFRIEECDAILGQGVRPSIYLYARTSGDVDLRARMFAPLSGVPEDPATGSAACAVAALLSHHRPEPGGAFEWRIAQGVEMGRPSLLVARAEKDEGVVRKTGVGGPCVFVAEGLIRVD